MFISELEYLEVLAENPRIVGSISSYQILTLNPSNVNTFRDAIANLLPAGISLPLERSQGLLVSSNNVSVSEPTNSSYAVAVVLTSGNGGSSSVQISSSNAFS